MNQIVRGFTATPPPAPGAVVPGNLYVDLGSRSMWLGVTPSVDPSSAVLISDLLGTMDEIAASEARAKAYADTGLLTKSDIGHVHTASQITDFDDAVEVVIASTPGLTFKRYTVFMYAGPATDIGSGDWAGWALCNGDAFDIPKPGGGTDHVVTPNLTDKFVLGRGTYGVGTIAGPNNPKTTADTNEAGNHSHTNTPFALLAAHLPAHTHNFGTLGGKTIGNTNAGGAHNHFITCATSIQSGGAYRPQLVQAGAVTNVFTDTEAAHQHATAMVVDITSGATGSVGSGTAHTHVMDTKGAHVHTISANELRMAVPFYAMAFVMKL